MLLQNKNDPLASQRLALVFQNYSLAFWSGLMISAVPVLALWTTVNHAVLLGWMLALWIELLVRYIYARRYSSAERGADERKWQAGVVAIAAIDGAFWGLSLWIFAVAPTAPTTLLLLLLIACVAIFDGKELAPIPLAAASCLLTTLLPVALWLFSFDTPQIQLMGIATLGYLALMLIFSRQTYHSICHLLSSSERNAELEAAQRENEQRMARYFESAPGYFFTLEFRRDSGSAITFASSGIRELFGLEPETVMRDFSAFIAIIHPDDLGMVFRKAEDSRRDLTPYHIEYRIIHPQKGVRWFEVHALPQRLANGNRRWDGFMYDITERKRMEFEVKQREAEFRALAENLPNPIFRYDRDCRRVYANPVAARISAMQVEELLGNTPLNSATMTPESAVRALEAIREVFATNERREIYVEYNNGDGKTREYKAQAVPEYDANGQVETALAILHEVTDLREAERRAASFFSTMPGFAFTFRLSPEGRMSFPFASRGIEELYGLRPEDVRDDVAPLHALAHPADQPRILSAISESAQTLQPLQVEVRVRRPGLPERWIECRSMPERQADGDVLWQGVMLDITERKRMEDSLREREREYRTLAENFPEVVIRYGRDYKRIYVNPAFVELAGKNAGELLGIHPQELSPLIDVDAYMEGLRNAMEEGEVVGMELPVRRANGKLGWYEGNFVPELDAGGNVVGVLMVAHDITERKHMEAALQQSEARYRYQHNLLNSILESPSKVAVYALDREYRFLAFNNLMRNGAKRLWGADIEVGMNMLEDALKHDDAYRAFCKQGFDYVLAGNNFYTESKQAQTKDGATYYDYHDNYGSPIYGDNGEVIGLTVFATNITERKQAEHKLEEYRAQLRGLLAQRESAREEERKLIARDVHDDLGQILTGLKMNLSVMERKCAADTPALHELIQQSRALMDSAIGTVRNISSALRPVELDMGIATAISWHAGRFATYTGITCEVHIDDEIHLDENEAVALFRIAQESLTNIAKHARASKVNISLMRESNDYVLKVCDNGSGFNVSLKKEGSFGLVGMRERVLMLGGTLSIRSEEGEGTEIVVRFPVAVQTLAEKS